MHRCLNPYTGGQRAAATSNARIQELYCWSHVRLLCVLSSLQLVRTHKHLWFKRSAHLVLQLNNAWDQYQAFLHCEDSLAHRDTYTNWDVSKHPACKTQPAKAQQSYSKDNTGAEVKLHSNAAMRELVQSRRSSNSAHVYVTWQHNWMQM